MDIPTFQTDRLILRAYQPSDLEYFLEMLSNRNVIRYLIHTEPWPKERVENWLNVAEKGWNENGIGFWILEHKTDNRPIGWCGLNKLQETGEVEVLYALDEPYWGQGLATEAAQFSVSYGFSTADLEEIIGLVFPENVASARVLEKCGLFSVGGAHYFGHDLLKYVAKSYTVGFDR